MTTQSSRRRYGFFMLAIATSTLTPLPALAQYQYQTTPAVAEVQTTQTQHGSMASIADLVEWVSPAVVNIKVTTDTGEVTSEGQGSGFIISPQGDVVTNYHVIEGGQNIEVVFNNNSAFPASVIGTDEETDLALLSIKSPSPFHHVSFYEGPPVRIGDWVVAIGNPYGIGQSTSLGIISAIGRDRVESGAYVDYIQTDATINTGNSGGPLFNPLGEVIGVNSAIFSPTGASVGIGFSIPHQTAKEVVTAIKQHGRVKRGYLGAGLRTAEYSSGPHRGGAMVNNVVTGSPAHLSGLIVDDIILKINGQAINDSVHATRLIGKFKAGQTARFVIERNEEIKTIDVRVAERPSKRDVEVAMAGGAMPATPSAPSTPAPAPSRPSSLSSSGLSLVDLSSTFRQMIGMRHDQVGVYVESVLPGSSADQSGVKTNMVLLEADQEAISSVSGFRNMLSKAQRANMSSILLLVREANGNENYLSLPL